MARNERRSEPYRRRYYSAVLYSGSSLRLQPNIPLPYVFLTQVLTPLILDNGMFKLRHEHS
jgi:hypothetical protein